MAIINADPGDFNIKLASLVAGDILELAAGDYGALVFSNLHYDSPITIRGGSFSSVAFSRASGITLDGAQVTLTPTLTSTNNAQAIRVWSSDHIVITNATITGGLAINGVDPSATALDATGNVLGLPTGKGVNFESSNDCAITNSDISVFHKGITFGLGSNITVSGNTIHELRTTPISGTAISGLIITGNHSWDSHPWNFGGSGDHGDRIHIWTDKTSIPGVVIADNLLEQGAGDPMLGIYLDDNGKGLGFPDAVITGNTVNDGNGQGILLENVSGTVSDNTLIWSGTGNIVNDSPRFQISGGSHDIVFTDNTGNVSITAGSYNLQFWHQQGSFTYDGALLAQDRLSITQDLTVVTNLATFALDDVTDNLTYFGSGNFNGIGNDRPNVITGGIGDDVLVGNGGVDTFDGKGGNDSYYVDNAAETITDSGGIDSVFASISWTLQSGLENLYFTGGDNATLLGNTSNNIIVGGTGDDFLNGGLGQDSYDGGLGNDLYLVDNLTQTVTDAGGIDTIATDRSYVLGATIENLVFLGTKAGNLTGNALANLLRGNDSANIIDGGTGADTLVGGGGNDTYVVDNVADIAIEVEGGIDLGGIDLVRASTAAFTLAEGIENLTYSGISAFSGTGNGLANVMTGNKGVDSLFGLGGNDTLSGGFGNDLLDGGAGADVLTGGSSNDTFVFAKGEADGDSVTDYNGNGAAAGDSIRLTGWGAGTTMVKGSGSFWVITDGIDHSVATVTIAANVHATDIIFG